MTSFTDALSIIRTALADGRTLAESVPLVLANGRTLAERVIAGETIPAADNSALDGYAVRAADIADASPASPVTLRLIGEAPAGRPFSGTIDSGEAIGIMTGGMIPTGADTVVEIEVCHADASSVRIAAQRTAGHGIRRRGEDVEEGREILSPGKRLIPGDIGLLAALGAASVVVRTKPTVGILATGNELVEFNRRPEAGQIRNSSTPALYAACLDAGAEPIDLGIVGDDPKEIAEAIEEGLRYDILLTTGGVSAGRYDYVQHVFPELGVTPLFHKVAVKPGKPILFGIRHDPTGSCAVFGLPGNPVSTMVTFAQFVRPAIGLLLGEDAAPVRLRARLLDPIAKKEGFRHFVRGRLGRDEKGEAVVSTTGTQSSGAISSMSRANGLIILDEESRGLDAGAMVEVELLGIHT